MKARPQDIKFYKGVLLDKIHSHLTKTGCYSIDEVDDLLKDMTGLSGSCLDFTHEQMQDLKETAKFLAEQIGCKIENID